MSKRTSVKRSVEMYNRKDAQENEVDVKERGMEKIHSSAQLKMTTVLIVGKRGGRTPERRQEVSYDIIINFSNLQRKGVSSLILKCACKKFKS